MSGRCGGSGMADEYLTVAELAKRAGVSESKARRYARAFAGLLETRISGRARRYSLEAVETVRHIAGLYGQGLGTKQVRQCLADDREQSAAQAPEAMTARNAPDSLAASKAQETPDAGLGGELAVLRSEMQYMAGELGLLRSEVRRLTGELEAARGKVGDLTVQVQELRRNQEDQQGQQDQEGLERRLEALILEQGERLGLRLAELETMQGPASDFLRLPLVFRSEQGEYLGVSDKQSSQHFSLRDFIHLVYTSAGQRKDVDTTWQRSGTAGWRLIIRERAPLTGRSKSHHVDVERFLTPKGNLVARLAELCFDGQAVPPFFVYELFRQIGQDFA